MSSAHLLRKDEPGVRGSEMKELSSRENFPGIVCGIERIQILSSIIIIYNSYINTGLPNLHAFVNALTTSDNRENRNLLFTHRICR